MSTHLTAHEGLPTAAYDSIKEILGGVRVGDERFDVLTKTSHILDGDMNYPQADSETPRSKRDENLTAEEEEYRKRMLETSMNVGAEEDDTTGDGKEARSRKKEKVLK